MVVPPLRVRLLGRDPLGAGHGRLGGQGVVFAAFEMVLLIAQPPEGAPLQKKQHFGILKGIFSLYAPQKRRK